MTDRPPPPPDPSPLPTAEDLAVSAYVDGEATPDERVLVEADPALMQRVDRYRDQREAMAVETPAGLADDQVAAALAAFDRLGLDARRDEVASGPDVPGASSSGPGVSAGAPPWWRRVPLGAAAAVVAAVLGLGALTQLDVGTSDQDTAATVADAADESTAGPTDAGSGGGFDAGSDAGSDGPTAGFDTDQDGGGEQRLDAASVEELVARLDAATRDGGTNDAPTSTAASTAAPVAGESAPDDTALPGQEELAEDDAATAGASGCDVVAAAEVDPAAVVEQIDASVDGQPVTVLRTLPTGADDVERLVIVDDATCTVIFDRTG